MYKILKSAFLLFTAMAITQCSKEENGSEPTKPNNGTEQTKPNTKPNDFSIGKNEINLEENQTGLIEITSGNGDYKIIETESSRKIASAELTPDKKNIKIKAIKEGKTEKSTLVSALSNARPKIANYPFTTLEPSLGIVPYRDGRSFVMADIPGIIEGAAEGRGLGLRFLRHIERNSLLLFMVPGDTDNIKREYEILLKEVSEFNEGLLNKHRVLAVTKSDLLDEELMEMLKEELPEDLPVVFISAVTGHHIQELKDLLWQELNSESNKLQSVAEGGSIVHRDREVEHFDRDFSDWADDVVEIDDDDIEELEDYEIEDVED